MQCPIKSVGNFIVRCLAESQYVLQLISIWRCIALYILVMQHIYPTSLKALILPVHPHLGWCLKFVLENNYILSLSILFQSNFFVNRPPQLLPNETFDLLRVKKSATLNRKVPHPFSQRWITFCKLRSLILRGKCEVRESLMYIHDTNCLLLSYQSYQT